MCGGGYITCIWVLVVHVPLEAKRRCDISRARVCEFSESPLGNLAWAFWQAQSMLSCWAIPQALEFFLLILCMYLFGGQRTTCVISFHICPGDPAQVTGLGSKCLYPLSHLSDCLISMHKKAFRSYSGLQEDNYLFPICVLPFIS